MTIVEPPGQGGVRVYKDGVLVASRPSVNIITGDDQTLTVVDNAGQKRVDVTLDVAGPPSAYEDGTFALYGTSTDVSREVLVRFTRSFTYITTPVAFTLRWTSTGPGVVTVTTDQGGASVDSGHSSGGTGGVVAGVALPNPASFNAAEFRVTIAATDTAEVTLYLELPDGTLQKQKIVVAADYFSLIASRFPTYWYPMDETSGTAVLDATANGYDGTEGDTIARNVTGDHPTNIPGPVYSTSAFGPTNTTAYVISNNTPDHFDVGGGRSAELWFKYAAADLIGVDTHTMGIFANETTVTDGVLTGIARRSIVLFNDGAGSSGLILGGQAPGRTAVPSLNPSVPTPDVWHHVVLTYGTDDMKLYLDGQLVEVSTWSPSLAGTFTSTGSGTDQSTFGGNDATGRSLIGEMCHAALYSGALSADDVFLNYAVGSAS